MDHVFIERMPGLLTRTDVLKRGRADHNAFHKVIFVIKQRNMDKLTSILHDVSDPASTSYGLHLSREEVLNMTSNIPSRDSVVMFLLSRSVRVISETLGGEYIIAEASISEWEIILDTKFYKFGQIRSSGHITEVTRAERYSIPRVLESHVQGVLNTVDMPLIRNRRSVNAKIIPTRTEISDSTLSADYGFITPEKLNTYYNAGISSGSNRSTQAIFASIGQTYSPADLKQFQTLHNLHV